MVFAKVHGEREVHLEPGEQMEPAEYEAGADRFTQREAGRLDLEKQCCAGHVQIRGQKSRNAVLLKARADHLLLAAGYLPVSSDLQLRQWQGLEPSVRRSHGKGSRRSALGQRPGGAAAQGVLWLQAHRCAILTLKRPSRRRRWLMI
jgi:hypothetical protein